MSRAGLVRTVGGLVARVAELEARCQYLEAQRRARPPILALGSTAAVGLLGHAD